MNAPVNLDTLPEWRLDDLYTGRDDPRIDVIMMDEVGAAALDALNASLRIAEGLRQLGPGAAPAERPDLLRRGRAIRFTPSFHIHDDMDSTPPGGLRAGHVSILFQSE